MTNITLFDICNISSEYFDKILDIIIDPNPLNEQYTEKHHIIPRFIYKDLNVPIDNSNFNLIELSIKNHILIHYYLAKCCKKEYRFKCLNSVLRTLGNIKLAMFENNYNEIAEQIADTKKLLRETPMPEERRKKCGYNHYKFTEEERKAKFGVWKGKHSPKYKTKLSTETKEKISLSRKGKWKGHIVSEETRKKIGNKAKGRVLKPLNSETIEKIKQIERKIMFVKQKEYEIYKHTNPDITWNKWQRLFSDFIKQEHIKFNLNKPLNEKLNERQFKRYFYENRWCGFVNS